MWNELSEALAPVLVEGVVSVVVLLWGFAAVYAKRKWGIQIESVNRDALHKAIETGTNLVLDSDMSRQQKLETVLNHVQASVPDAIKALSPSQDVLITLIMSRLEVAARSLK
jgi:hypothetical protein